MSLALKKRYLMSLVQSGGVSPRLPSAYQEVEYIESSGAQRIDTGIKLGSKTELDIDYSVNSPSSADQNPFGCYTQINSTYIVFALSIKSTGSTFWCGNVLNHFNYNNNISVNANQRYNAKLTYQTGNQSSAYLDGVRMGTSSKYQTSAYYSNSNTIRLFGLYAYNSMDNYLTGKIYRCAIKQADTLVRDFVPCYRKSDNEIGLYDLVNDQFYTNQGSGTFTCGVPIIYDSRYQQVEYIQSSGTQYLNLNRTLNQTNKIELDFQYLSEGTTSNPDRGALFGDYGGTMFAANPNAKSSYYHNRMLVWRGNDNVVIDTGTTSATPFTNRGTLVIDAPNNKTSWLGFTQTTTSGTGNTTGCWLLAVRDADGTTMYPTLVPTKVFSLKIYTSGVLSNYYIPVYRRSDNEIGLLDIVNDVFYTNQGSGVFTKGQDI